MSNPDNQEVLLKDEKIAFHFTITAMDGISMFLSAGAIILTSLICALWILVEFNIQEVINFIAVLFDQAPLFDSPRKPPSIDNTNMSDVGSEALSRRSRGERFSVYRNSCHFIIEEEENELREGIIEEEEEPDGFTEIDARIPASSAK